MAGEVARYASGQPCRPAVGVREQAADLTARFLAAERADFAVIIDRAVGRGELARHIDPALAHLLLAGPHVAALYAFHDPVDEALIGHLATAAAAGLVALAS